MNQTSVQPYPILYPFAKAGEALRQFLQDYAEANTYCHPRVAGHYVTAVYLSQDLAVRFLTKRSNPFGFGSQIAFYVGALHTRTQTFLDKEKFSLLSELERALKLVTLEEGK